MKFIDTAPIAGTRRTADGYLVAEVRTARTGIQFYAGHEVGATDKNVVRVYRPAEHVFAKDSLGSYAHRPVTNDHPSEAVTADNWRDHAVGQIGDEVARSNRSYACIAATTNRRIARSSTPRGFVTTSRRCGS